ncbi:MAG: GntR family transcriptional regulator [Chloroflexi bacterium]|nr:GntR family transcriptional regulator [Chloroflexota bacterium]
MEVLSVTASALQLLRERIITGELKPGQKLNESVLSDRLGISRPPLREAFRLLENDHLVVNIPRRGTYVPELTAQDYTEVAQIREMVECYAIDLLEAAGTRILPKVDSALHRAENLPVPPTTAGPEDLLAYIKVLLSFHQYLVESSGNSLLAQIHHSISFYLARYQFVYFRIDGTVQHSLPNHRRTAEFIREGKYDQAKEELRKHIQYAVETVKNEISQPAKSRTG